jgi:hypothetical protein
MPAIPTTKFNRETRSLVVTLNVHGWIVHPYGFSSRCHATNFIVERGQTVHVIPTVQCLRYFALGVTAQSSATGLRG